MEALELARDKPHIKSHIMKVQEVLNTGDLEYLEQGPRGSISSNTRGEHLI